MKCKPTVKDIFEFINSIAPFEKQCEWDNSGFLVGNADEEVSKIGVVLDITNDAIKRYKSYSQPSSRDIRRIKNRSCR